MEQTIQAQDLSTPDVVVSSDNCQVDPVNGGCRMSRCRFMDNRKEASTPTTDVKARRKARSTRRRLNAMINNTSLHFSDTDSEGELTTPRVSIPSKNSSLNSNKDNNLLRPVISVTLDGSDNSSCGNSRRGSFMDNLTDVDEIYTSEPESGGSERRRSRAMFCNANLVVGNPAFQAETDLEDLSNDEEEPIHPLIYIMPRADILCDFNGETITTKEGDGPFSVEVRNQMSFDESKIVQEKPDIMILPTTDSEDMEASDDDEILDEASGLDKSYQDFDVLDDSQIVMKNVNKMEQLLSVKELDDSVNDIHTDVEDLE